MPELEKRGTRKQLESRSNGWRTDGQRKEEVTMRARWNGVIYAMSHAHSQTSHARNRLSALHLLFERRQLGAGLGCFTFKLLDPAFRSLKFMLVLFS